MASKCAHHCCQLAAQECAARTIARHPLCVQRSHGRTDNRSASRRTRVRNSGAPTVAQLPEHRTGTSAQPEQELRQHGCTLQVAIARARVTTAPSFLKQNGGTYGVIRRQDTDNRALKIRWKTAMGSNRTAITLQSVLGQSSPEPDSLTEAQRAESSARRVLRPEGAYQTVCQGSLGRDRSILAVSEWRNSPPEKT